MENITRQQIADAISKLFGNLEDTEPLENKVLDGYAYSINGENMTLNTGKGGVLMYIEIMRNKGVPNFLIASTIIVHTEHGSTTLKHVKVIDKKTSDS
jgi:hypothetical protein